MLSRESLSGAAGAAGGHPAPGRLPPAKPLSPPRPWPSPPSWSRRSPRPEPPSPAEPRPFKPGGLGTETWRSRRPSSTRPRSRRSHGSSSTWKRGWRSCIAAGRVLGPRRHGSADSAEWSVLRLLDRVARAGSEVKKAGGFYGGSRGFFSPHPCEKWWPERLPLSCTFCAAVQGP